MAYYDDTFSGTTLRQRLTRFLETAYERRYRQRTETIASLRAKSDAELASMGLTREGIVTHVFAARRG